MRSSRRDSGGFALVVTVALMILLTLLAVGLLSLSAIALRSSSQGAAMAEARANARLSILLALGELQKSAGDDRRVTVDAGLVGDGGQPAAVGVWESWSPGYAEQPMRRQPNFDSEKSSRFKQWLVSHPDPAHFESEDAIKEGPANSWIRLFEQASDGFDLAGAPVPMEGGALAWAVTQENTKAKINVDGPEEIREPNDVLFAQERPYLGLSSLFQQPDGDWSQRAARVVSLNQADLDQNLVGAGGAAGLGGADFTTRAMGLLTNVVDGGLKTDLNLGFEMSDNEFAQASWDGLDNPFYSRNRSYRNERPLFEPLVDSGELQVTVDYGVIRGYQHKFDAAVVPTFDTLRSHYRTAHHLYLSQGQPTVFERPLASPSLPRQSSSSTGSSQPRIRPVLDRLLYFLSMWVDSERKLNLVITPVVTLWNPHNVALEMEGAVVYPWMDFPLNIAWKQYGPTGAEKRSIRNWQSIYLSSGRDTGEGRTREPYFFLEITANGDGNTSQPIRLEPGEVRVFTLADAKPVRFDRLAPDVNRTWRMRPVGGIRDFVTTGGVAVRQTQSDNTHGSGFSATETIEPNDRVDGVFEFTRRDHHYFITMEDAGRITRKTPQKVAEVQSHSSVLDSQRFTSPRFRGSEMMAEPKLVGVIESYHRVAVDATQVADLVCTTNPRQPYVNRYLIGGGTFAAGPHYEASMRSCAAIAGAGLQLTRDARNAYYGASNSSTNGRTKLAFFEVPRQPVLSIAGLQHADITSSAFGPSNQLGNSWASPYLQRGKVAEVLRTTTTGESIRPRGLPVVDSSYLANEALWDEFFFSGAAPTLALQSRGGSPNVWNSPQASETRKLSDLLKDFIADPSANALRNSAMRLHRGRWSDEDLLDRLLSPAGCRRIAAHLMVDGAFNVHSTSVEAWTAVLAGLRDAEFDVDEGAPPLSGETPFPRFRNPRGHSNDGWDGYRGLQDGELRKLAEEIVEEVRSRGPFLSLAEFVNRRPESGAEGLNGTLQAAIDRSGINDGSLYQRMITGNYPVGSNISPPNTGVGTPGYLTQADLLNSIGPRLTVRSDTFTIRGYGESRDKAGNVVASAWCEAVVQRVPEWVDPRQDPETGIADLNPGNTRFGRRFEIVSFRHIPAAERSATTI